MKINYFQISRRGDAALNWDGTEEEILYFKKWVEKYVPKKYFLWYDKITGYDSYNKTHLSGSFNVSAWTFLCYHWTNVHGPAINQEWKEKKNPYHPNIYPFESETSLVDHDRSIILLLCADLEKEARNVKTSELTECISFLKVKASQLTNKKSVV